ALDQGRHELDKSTACLFEPQRAMIAGQPLLHRGRDHRWLLEAERQQIIEQALVVWPGRVVEIGQLLRAGRIALEQTAVVPLHDVEVADEIPCESVAALIAEKVGKALDRL